MDEIIAHETILVLYSIVLHSQVFAAPLQEVLDVLKQSLQTLQSFSLCFIMEAESFNRFLFW
jgi:hypothetical protein